MIFRTLGVWWRGFWDSLFARGDARYGDIAFRGELASQRAQLDQLRRAMTGMIYHRKQLEDKRADARHEYQELQRDLAICLRENREELGIELLSRKQSLEADLSFMEEQIHQLQNDIAEGRTTEQALQTGISQAEQMIGTITSRYQVLRIRQHVRGTLDRVDRSAGRVHGPLKQRLTRLEAELENLNSTKSSTFDEERRALRHQRDREYFQEYFRSMRNGGPHHPTPTRLIPK